MDRAELVDQLQESLAVALRLNDAGHPDSTIACALGLPVQSVSVVLRVATAKLAHLETEGTARRVRQVGGGETQAVWSVDWRRPTGAGLVVS